MWKTSITVLLHLLYWNLHFKLVLNVCVRRIRNQNSCFSESFTCISSYHSPTTIICKSLLFAFHGSVAPPQSSLKNPAFAFHGIIAPPKPSRFEWIFWVPFLRYEESGKCCCFFLGGVQEWFLRIFPSVQRPLGRLSPGPWAWGVMGWKQGQAGVMWQYQIGLVPYSCLSKTSMPGKSTMNVFAYGCVSYRHKGISSQLCLLCKSIPQNQNDFLKIFIAKVFESINWCTASSIPCLGNMHGINARAFRF